MKILFIGSLISSEMMEELNNNSKEKASVAPVNYETMLIKGLVENGAEVECLSVPAVAAYPHSKYRRMPAKYEKLFEATEVKWVPFVNIQGLKQATIKVNIEKLLKQWLEKNKDVKDKVVLMYSIYPPYTGPALRLCKQYNCHLSTIITDLPEYMYSWKKVKGLRGWYSQRLSKQMLDMQGACDSYILFTKPMAKRMGIESKPFMVSEGFCDESIFADIPDQEKYPKKTIVYGGNLSKLYGVRNLVQGFMQTDLDAELHLYGAGGDAAFIEDCVKKDSRIKFFGRVDRKTLLCALKKTHLLVVNKPTSDDYSNYSFSSKILEYMVSGTPLLTTKVSGMPEEYLKYVYIIEDESVSGIATALTRALDNAPKVLYLFGQKAAHFVVGEKNYRKMTEKVLLFLKSQLREVK